MPPKAPPKKPIPTRRDFNVLLKEMATIIEERMVGFGSDPRSPADVDNFVNGIAVAKN